MKLLLIPSVVTLLSTAALAQDKPYPPPTESWVCYADYQKFCPKVEPGDGRIKACLATHKSELSDKCIDALRLVGTLSSAQKN